MALKKSLKLYDIFFISLGYIIGAGIYSLLYLITKNGGHYTWVSFIIGGIISIFTALSYSDLNSYFNTAASDYDYITKGITDKFKYITAFGLVFLGVFIMATLCLSFSNIIKKIIPSLPYILILSLTVIIPAIINILGAKTTSNINILVTIAETLILFILIGYGFYSVPFQKIVTTTLPTNKNAFNLNKIFHGAFLSVFAYSGFETIPKLSEETINSRMNVSKAMIYSILTVIVLYSLVSITINSILGVKKVSSTINPVTDALNSLFKTDSIVNTITLFSIFNTILLTVLFSSRQLYGISKKNIFPQLFARISKKTNTPIYSIITISILALVLCLIINIEKSSFITNLLTFILFILINLSACILAFKGKIKTKGLSFNLKSEKGEKGTLSYYSILGLISSIIVLYKAIFD